WATHYLPFQAMVLLVTWLQSGGFKPSAIVASIGAAPVHLRALWGALWGRATKWKATNAGEGARSLWAVMPHLTLLILNLTGIVVGIAAMTDPPPVWLSVGWATLIILILGRMILESVTGSPVAEPPPPSDDPPAGGQKPSPQPVTVPVSPSTL